MLHNIALRKSSKTQDLFYLVKIYLYLCIILCISLCVCVCRIPQRPEKDIRFPGDGGAGGWESPDVGNWTPVLLEGQQLLLLVELSLNLPTFIFKKCPQSTMWSRLLWVNNLKNNNVSTKISLWVRLLSFLWRFLW